VNIYKNVSLEKEGNYKEDIVDPVDFV